MDNLTRSFANFNQSVEKNYPIIPGEIGISLGGSRITEVPGRGQFVYVRLRSNQSEIVQVFNGKVFPGYGLPVLVKWNNNRYEIIGVDVQRYQQWVADNPHIAKHGATHSMDKENDRIGTDPVWVYPYQFMPSLVSPFPQSGIQNVYINPLMVQYGGDWKYIGNTGTSNLAAYKPTSGSSIVLISLDVTSGNPYLYSTTGTYIPLSTTGTSDLLSYLPSLDLGRYIPLSFVLLASGTSGITWNNLYDVRQFFSIQSSGTSYLSVNGVTQVNSLSFTGVTFSNTGTSAFIDVVASGGGGGSFYPNFTVEGALETGTSQSQPYLVTDDFTGNYAYLYLENLGTTGTTKADLLKNGVSIFTGGYQLQIPYNSTGSWVRAVPYYSSFVIGDILTLSINGKATGAGNLLAVISPSSTGGGSSSVTVSDGLTSVAGVSNIQFSSGTVVDMGGGVARVVFPDYGMVLITGAVASSSTELAFPFLPIATYDEFLFDVIGLLPATNAVDFYAQISSNGGVSYVSSNLYAVGGFAFSSAGSTPFGQGVGSPTSSIKFRNSNPISNNTNYGIVGTVKLSKLNANRYKQLFFDLHWLSTTNVMDNVIGSGAYLGTGTVDAIKFYFSSGNLANGEIKLYGLRK